ncbi:hypothetical protein G7Y89_g6586 [Cudoniella acicularis]|uniref:Protein kinase domain-containing protein n=1 Tax=Cudoniella acicularis TaxID=354080 RepID=A0A8H4RLZ7_9HELO|nr:hypothetical protein G7Y89_g6586 [Cudoniella acicularis]
MFLRDWISRQNPWSTLLRWYLTLYARVFSVIPWLWSNQQGAGPIDNFNEGESNVGESAFARETKRPIYDSVRQSKGELIGGGASGIIERLSTGEIVKSPWPGRRAEDCCRDMATEFQIYTRLGPHPRLVHIINWDPKECVLTMEYMDNGNLKDFILAKNDSISIPRRLQWAREAAEGLQILHAANVIHCDPGPKNFFLDNNLHLKIADFAGSSVDGYQPSACANQRFLPPDFDWRRQPLAQDDLFGLGSLIYFIMTGHYPFHELASDEVELNYKTHKFPEVKGIKCGDVITRCWNLQAGSAQDVLQSLQDIV